MGRHLNFGIATTIYVEKSSKYDLNEIKSALAKSLNLNIYTMEEDEDYIYLSLKEDVFMKNYEKLIKKEYKRLNVDKEDYAVFDEIKHLSYDELLEEMKEKTICHPYFQFTSASGYCSNDISYMLYDKYHIEISADIITFYLSDKVSFETYYNIFKYLRSKIILNMDTPLKDAVFISIA